MRVNLFVPYNAQPGRLGRALRKHLPTWYFSPVRRAVQSAALVVFLILLFHVCRPAWSPAGRAEISEDAAAVPGAVEPIAPETGPAYSHRAWGIVPAQTFLLLDPLVSVTAAVAGGAALGALLWAGALLAASVALPRAFCGYLCPMGTLVDVTDWALGRRTARLHVRTRGWWTHARFYLLAGLVVSAVLGVLLSGFVAAIPLVTRGLTSAFNVARGAGTAGQYLALGLFVAVLGLSALGSRFWCRVLCPTGAVISLFSLLRPFRRRVNPECISCGRCARTCSFGAVREDFTARSADCTLCQTCAGACPVQAIEFTGWWRRATAKPAGGEGQPVLLSRRGFLVGGLGGAAAALLVTRLTGAETEDLFPVRPPGSLPEPEFRETCVRCGQCVKACPTGLLQPMGLELGPGGLWTPRAVANRGACAPSCNRCGQVCPTGAILPFTCEQKRSIRMGRAAVDGRACMAHAGNRECELCGVACADAGYEAISLEPRPTGGAGPEFMVPSIDPRKCVGCGACQAACYAGHVRGDRLLTKSAIAVEAGPGRDVRLVRLP